MTTDNGWIDTWVSTYARAWREKDADLVVSLFTPHGIYRSVPTESAHVGRDAIAAYWRRATQDQVDLDLRMGTPVVAGRRAAVEWWALMRDREWMPEAANDSVTLPGCLVLSFDDQGLCTELREYYNPVFGKAVPAPQGWGD